MNPDHVHASASAIDALVATLQSGGFVAPPLLGIAVLLWFSLGERFVLLRRHRQGASITSRLARWLPSALDVATLSFIELSNRDGRALRASDIDDVVHHTSDLLGRHRSLVRTLVTIAPLLGLLGTVSGMIETFDSLATMSLHTQAGGGVTGGISEALVSTEMGLVVAVPGLLIGRLLDGAEAKRRRELQAISTRDVRSLS